MSMSTAKLKNAFREAASSEFSVIPLDENSIHYAFSERFQKKMEKLIQSRKKSYWRFVNTKPKKAAIIGAILMTLLSTACGVKAIREPIVEFFVQIYETFTHYTFKGDTTGTITKEYSFSPEPEGFELAGHVQKDNFISNMYENDVGDVIELSQMTTENSVADFDAEKNEVYTEWIDGMKVHFYVSAEVKKAIWTKDGYYFELSCYGNFRIDTVKQLILTIK